MNVLGVILQGFINPDGGEVVFSNRGISRALNVPETTLRRILASEEFKTFCSKDSACAKLLTEVSPKPIAVSTQADLAVLVKLLADKGYPVPRSMQDAGFPVVLQQSVDEALNVQRDRQEYPDSCTFSKVGI